MEPTVYNIECLSADYTRMPNRYAGAHVFFLPGLTDDLALKVRNSVAGRHVKRMEEVFIDFFPTERLVYSLDNPFSSEIFFNRNCRDLVNAEVTKTAQSIASVCATLGEYPVIRFQKPPKESYEASMLSFMVASAVQREIDRYARHAKDYPPPSDGRPRSILLIADRSIDPYAPLVHEFTYQAMAYDLLPIKKGNKFMYMSEKANGVKEETEGLLHEKDAEWVHLRHLHMQDTIDSLTAKLEKFKKENPHLVDQGTQSSVSDLQDMIAALPMFAEMKERFALHLQMANECMELFQKKDLNAVADVEQTLATGVAADGRKAKGITDEMIELLADAKGVLDNKDKVRIIILYSLFRGGLIEQDYEKLKFHCGLQDIDIQVIRNLQLIGALTVKAGPKAKLNKDLLLPRFHGAASGDVYETSRFVPGLKNVLDNLIRGTLSPEQFPYTRDDPSMDAEDFSQPNSLRNPRQRAVWAKNPTSVQMKQRMFVFVVGGVTFSETRSAYELSSQYSKDIIIGGSCTLTPITFLRNLSRFAAPRNQLGLPMDQPKPRAPQFLFESDRETQRHQQAQAQAQAQGQPLSQRPGAPGSAVPNRATPSPGLNGGKEAKDEKKSKRSKFGKLFK
uniref:ARAD1D22308p n=1 Tax=Blastobotrys adeninivorans TaxID=409370 RepID=A0A060TGB8_BLAAD